MRQGIQLELIRGGGGALDPVDLETVIAQIGPRWAERFSFDGSDIKNMTIFKVKATN